MSDDETRRRVHDLDVSLWVGKAGIDAVTDELASQLEDHEMVKVKFLRAARGGSSTEELAVDLADQVDADLVETRGHTAVVQR